MRIPLSYTWRSLWTRRLTTLLTLGGITLVVFVFAAVLMLSNGIEQALIETGSEDNIIVLRRSAQSELLSQIDRDAANIIRTIPEAAQTPAGKPFVSAETFVIINLKKKGSGDMGNISLRGIAPEGMQLRPQVRLMAGRMFATGSNEIIVGANIAKRFEGTEIGSRIGFGDANWTIVGHFDAQGTAFDSEIWGDVEQFMPAFGRPVFSSMTIRLRDANDFQTAKDRIARDPRTQTSEAKRERVYYSEQSELMSKFIKILGLVVTGIFSIGAVIAAMITMYAAVANRTVEIGTMRALGFKRRTILAAFLVESILLSAVGGGAGIFLASLLSFVRISTVNFGSFSELAFGFVMSPGVAVSAALFSLTMGIAGGFEPARRAARMNIVAALRAS